MFPDLIPRLSDAYYVIATDYPAFGHSPVPGRFAFGYPFDHLADVSRLVGMIWSAFMAGGHGPQPAGTGVVSGEIRPADDADLSAVVACVGAAYGKYVLRMGREPAPMLADYPSLIARGMVHVLPESSSDGLRGLIVLWPTDGAMFVENVAVHPRYQRQGLGRRLMAFAEEQARAAGLPEVRLYTNEVMTENLAFYRDLGFEETVRRVDEGYRRVFLRKILGQH